MTHKCMNQTETSGKCQENANQNHTEAASHLCTTIIFFKKNLKIINCGAKGIHTVGGNVNNYSYYGTQHECSIRTAN